MKSQDLKKYKLPDSPGVYIFKKGRSILYIGKATSLKDRVKSYFAKDISFSRSLLIEQMIKEADSIKTMKTDSVLEALILEANLIKKHKPKYNTKEKDDKSFNFVVITNEEYPRVFTVRGHELPKKKYVFKYIFGPYPQGGSLKEVLKIIRKIFPFRGEKAGQSKLSQEIGLSPSDSVSKKEYTKTINNIRLFLEGKSSQVFKNLRTEMRRLAKEQEFERAERRKRQIFALEHINDVALLKDQFVQDRILHKLGNFKIEAYDVAHISGSSRVGVMVAVVDGEPKKNLYRKFKVQPQGPTLVAKKVGPSNHQKDGGDTWALAQILERRLNHPEWTLPKLIVVDGGKAQKNTAERVLTGFGYQIPVVTVTKGPGHRAQKILGLKLPLGPTSGISPRSDLGEMESMVLLANSEAHRFALKWHREKRQENLK